MLETLQNVTKEPENLSIVRFQDCDPLGHLNNARYFDYFFNARQDHLAQFYDFYIFQWGKDHGANWVVTQNQIAYLRPAMMMEEVTIRTCLIQFSETTILIEGMMFDKEKRRLKAILWTEFTYISAETAKTQKHPPELDRFLRDIYLENSFAVAGFANRVQSLKQATRTPAVLTPKE